MVGPSVISARLHLYLVAFLVSSVGGSMAPARASAVGYTLGFELHEPAPTRFGQFGFAVALVGNDMLVGAPGTEDFGPARPGAAYLFDGTTGALRHTFTRPVASERDTFGFAVAAVGSTIAIAAPSDGTAGDEAGAVYVFDAGTGALIRTLLSPNPVDEGYFGWSVAAVGSNLMVGARNDLIYGAAYLFDGATGALLRTFLNPTPGAGSLFGWSVAAVGANVAVGDPGGLPGAAHLFDAASGALLQSFVSPVQGEEEQFGFAVAGVGPDVLVGAVFNDTGGEDAGTAYLFDGATGALRRTFPNPTPASPDYYGWAVGEIGGDVLVSSIEAGSATAPAAARSTASTPRPAPSWRRSAASPTTSSSAGPSRPTRRGCSSART